MTRTSRDIVALILAAGVLAACLGGEGGTSDEGGATETAGGRVTVLGGWVDADEENFNATVAPFEDETGIDVVYSGSSDFETALVTRVEAGDPPDVTFIPPGLLGGLAEDGGAARPLDDLVDVDRLSSAMIPGLLESVTFDDALYGVPFRVTVKSLVWYPKGPFEEQFAIPQTLQELQDLAGTMNDEGTAPWCLGIESSGSTGWVVTDWIEDLVLRTAGPEAYDRWVAGELPFTSPEIMGAARVFEEMVLAEGMTTGGRAAIISTPFGDAPLLMFEDPPACWMHRQASFIAGFFPEDVAVGEDVDFFYFPPAPGEGAYDGRPVLGAGAFGVLLTDSPAAEQFIRFIATPEAGEGWAQAGSFVSPYRDFDPSLYANDALRQQAEIVANADVFRFDASDLMPGEVGSGSFWTQMVAWINQEQSLQEAMAAIDDSWPDGD